MFNKIHCVIASIILFVFQETTICTAQNNSSNSSNSSNLVLRKQATQSGVFAVYNAGRDADFDASRAVDGNRTSMNNSRYCSRVDTSDSRYHGNRDYAWWQVALAGTYTVINVTIFNTDNVTEWQFLNNFTVYVSIGSDVSHATSDETCQWVKPNPTTDVGQVPRNGSYTVICTRPLVGRYVTIQRIGGLSPGRMTLCEVEVEGTRYYSCENCREDCNHDTGCSTCNAGFIPPSCTKYCKPGTYGINCVSQCSQCSNTDLPCDTALGHCPCVDGSDCIYSYNTALGKQVSQSGMYYGLDASRAVDGYIYSQSDSRRCASVDTSDGNYHGNRDYAWWQVDLADIYTVISVTIFNTDNEQEWQFLYDFAVYVSRTSDVSDEGFRMVCQLVRPDPIVIDGVPYIVRVPRNGSFVVDCVTPLVGQYVTIKRTGGLNPGRMTLCEVAVSGVRYHFCQNCRENCLPNSGCATCNPGFSPPSCTKVCRPGTFGINCTEECPQCPKPCDVVTGQCPCLDGSDCTYSNVTSGSNTTPLGVGGTDAPDGSLQGASTSGRKISGVDQFRSTGATVLASLVLFAFCR